MAITVLDPTTNGAKKTIELNEPYAAIVKIEGVSALLFHAWNVEAVAEKAKAAKGSKAKKSDDVESYVYRNETGEICMPGEYLRQAIIHAAKYVQDPRSPRKSAMDLFKAGIVVQTELASLGKTTWDFLDQRRVLVQRNGINRTRPAFVKGWTAEFWLQVILPEYISRELLATTITNAGRLVGVGDFRPTYGRFNMVGFEVLAL